MRRIDLAALLVLALVVGAAAVSAAPVVQDRKRTAECANNLSQLWKMTYNYMAQFGGADKLFPQDSGDAFWLRLSKTTPPLIESGAPIYQCPVENAKDEGCDYRGPAKDINSVTEPYFDADPVGADVDGNHGEGKGGNVLRKSSDVLNVAASDPIWSAAAVKTSGGNKAIPPKPSTETAKQKQACVDIGHLAIAAMLYREFMGAAPKSLKDLSERPKDADWWPDGGFMTGGKVPKDPWGSDYQYTPGERDMKIWSWGADDREGGDGENADVTLDDLFKGRAGATPAGAMASNERNASATLKTISTAQADFRSNDRDGNLVNDFWTGDVYSLYALCPLSNGKDPDPKPTREKAIRLIEPSAAEADAAPADVPSRLPKPEKPVAKAGYFYRAMEKDEAGEAYGHDTDGRGEKLRNRSKFGVCAYPAEYGKTGRMTYIINEDFTVWKKDTGGEPVRQMPADLRKDGWNLID